MATKPNPFHELYVTESFGAESFVKLFSDVLVNHSSALFKPGNVILQGLPGTGKSMMLNLLKPSIRIAYKKCNIEFPVPKNLNKFIGAGINLIRSSVADFGQRYTSDNLNELAIYFGDFLNYWVVRDILLSIKELSQDLSTEIGINYTDEKLNKFTELVKKDTCWFGYLEDVQSYEMLLDRFKHRIVSYRSYLHFNSDEVEEKIKISKTAIGIPISKIVSYLKDCQIINQDVNVYIRIDQFEELAWLDNEKVEIGSKFKAVINKLLAMRDTTVSYRIGTRPFAWKEDKHEILGTSAKLELDRNYLTISIDDVLRRPENIKTYIFPKFAEDIFEKRLSENGFYLNKSERPTKSLLTEVFGEGLNSTDKASRYFSSSKEKAILLDPKWPKKWQSFLTNLSKSDPFSAKLGEAWARQKGKGDIVNNIPKSGDFPWDSESKKYWKKERTEQALIQIASRNRQQLIWEGSADILTLSGGNILAFLSLCQNIWEVWLRDSKVENITNHKLPKIGLSIQTLGILEASKNWFDKISRENGGRERKQFITYTGVLFHKSLVEDINMSYPGHNGFSVEASELESYKKIDIFLKQASDYGDLQDRPHTTKHKDRKQRIKWFLNPILSPYFKIPAAHTKEPMYITMEKLQIWLEDSIQSKVPSLPSKEILKKEKAEKKSKPVQISMFKS